MSTPLGEQAPRSAAGDLPGVARGDLPGDTAPDPLSVLRPFADDRYETLAQRFRPVFARIGADSLERERAETLATTQLRWLTDAGFARIRTPPELGGLGGRLSDLFRLLAELAEVDPNLAHIWRNHYSFVEDRLHAPRDERTAEWLERLGRGEIVGGGWSEAEPAQGTAVDTTIVPVDGGFRVTGAKYYSTGSVYADWFTVLAVDPDGQKIVALVDAHQDAVYVGDDWDGFGQRLTGSGSVTYDGAFVEARDAIAHESRYAYQAQYYQTVMHAILVGIGRAVVRDAVTALRARKRSYPTGSTESPADDPQILEAVGRISGLAFAAEGAFAQTLAPIDAFVDAHDAGDTAAAASLATTSWIAVAQAQTVITDSVLDAATLLFDVLGASGTSRALSLDRHWRNARTLSSHNPRVFKRRMVGDWLTNGVDPAG